MRFTGVNISLSSVLKHGLWVFDSKRLFLLSLLFYNGESYKKKTTNKCNLCCLNIVN